MPTARTPVSVQTPRNHLDAALPPLKTEHGFVLQGARYYPEYEFTASIFKHQVLGTTFVSIEGKDEDKVFSIAFPTVPTDDSGVFHIIEHVVLSGSKNFPVKDPFAAVNTTSLKSFANAITYPDHTSYIVASPNQQDYLNNARVYLDAVLNPLNRRETFLKEGWRYEFDSEGKLATTGKVLNEMKGLLSEPGTIAHRALIRALYPDSPYRFDSGGDPEQITRLSYEAFLQTYKDNYHPSKAIIVAYGNHDRGQVLSLLSGYLEGLDPSPCGRNIPRQPALERPVVVKAAFPVQAQEVVKEVPSSGYLTIGWSLEEEKTSPINCFSMGLLTQCLAGNSGCPLSRAVLSSGMAEDLGGCGFLERSAHSSFILGASGIKPGNIEKVEQLIYETLEKVAKTGFPEEVVEAALHQIEFNLRENDSSGEPAGIEPSKDVIDAWLSGSDILDKLSWEKPLENLKAQLAGNPRFLESIIEEKLLKNPHRASVHLVPDEGLLNRITAAERKELEQRQSDLTPRERGSIEADQAALALFEETPDTEENLAKIPMLKVKDLSRNICQLPSTLVPTRGGSALCTTLPCKGILYTEAGFNLKKLPLELLPYTQLFAEALTETGTRTQSYEDFLHSIDRWTGSLSASCSFVNVSGSREFEAWLSIGGKTLATNHERFLQLMTSALLEADFSNRERIASLAVRLKGNIENAILSRPHAVGVCRARANHYPAAMANEMTEGLEQLFFIRNLVNQIDNNWDGVRADLESFRKHLIHGNGLLWNITGSPADVEAALKSTEKLAAALPSAPAVFQPWKFSPLPRCEAWTIPSQVNFVVHSQPLAITESAGELLPADTIANSLHVSENVTGRGGAYGAGTFMSLANRHIDFWSFRDPNIERTLETFSSTGEFARDLLLRQDHVDGAIIGTIGRTDSPMGPSETGAYALGLHLIGQDPARRQQIRDSALSADPSCMAAYGEAIEGNLQDRTVCVIGNGDAIRDFSKEFEGELVTKSLL